jgi:hypothetical protein
MNQEILYYIDGSIESICGCNQRCYLLCYLLLVPESVSILSIAISTAASKDGIEICVFCTE